MKEPKIAAIEIISELPDEIFVEKSWDMLCFASYLLFALRHSYPFIENVTKELLILINTYHQIEVDKGKNEQERASIGDTEESNIIE